MHTFLEKIGAGIVILGTLVGGFFGYTPAQPEPVEVPVYVEVPSKLGASVQTPDVRALFETTLASRITTSDTSFTLTSATDFDGNTLSSSTYGFIIDEGTASEEMVLADCTATACTNATRGLSGRTGTTSVTALKKEHRRGASVKMTDAPSLLFAINVLKGTQNIENKLRYNSNLSFTNDADVVSKKYVDDVAFSGAGVIDATASARGISELATQLETASSSTNGSSGVLVIPASNATSTYNSATAPLRVVVTQNSGKIDANFLPTTYATTTINAISTTTTVGNPPIKIMDIGKNVQVFTSTGTFTVPAGVKVFHVQVLGGGEGGGDPAGGVTGFGGGSGGFVEGWFDLTGTSTVGVAIGAAGTANGGDGGTSWFGSIASSTGGNGSGTGGIGFATTSSMTISALNTRGAPGTGAYPTVTGNPVFAGALGGSTRYGAPGKGSANSPTEAGYGYGYGGTGGGTSGGNGQAGGAGLVIVEW